MTTLVTGAAGFIGTALTQRLIAEGRSVRAASRRSSSTVAPGAQHVVADLTEPHTWAAAVAGARAVVHLGARVHVMRDAATEPLAEYRRVNVGGTVSLARYAADAGVQRFVFISSVKVHGETGVYNEADTRSPQDAYGISKREAEDGLLEVTRDSSMEVVIVRPPLVYGPGVRANFLALAKAIAAGYPLPLASVTNLRSLVAIDNLVDFLVRCLDHPAAANQAFLVSDGEDLSTADLARSLGRALNRPARLVPFPPALLVRAGSLVGRRAAVERLVGTLRVDITKARQRLRWSPPYSVDEGLRRFAAALQSS